jgi:hypothetical protein
MASITFAIDEELKSKLSRFKWVTWSELVREELKKKAKLFLILKKLESKEDKELNEWSVKLGRETKKKSFEKLINELSPEEREKLKR